MNTNIHASTLAIMSAIVLVIALPQVAEAADSTSYRLYDTLSDVSDQAPLASDSYTLDEGGGTWTDQPIAGSTFQIVTGGPVQASSSSSVSSSDSSSEQSENDPEESAGGGRRDTTDDQGVTDTEDTEETDTPVDDADEEEQKPAAPTEPTLPAQIIDQTTQPSAQTPSANGGTSGGTSGGSGGGSRPIGESKVWRPIDTPHYFDMKDAQVCECPEPVRCAATTTTTTKTVKMPIYKTSAASASMVLIAFLLGHVSHYARPGNARVPLTKSKTKSKSKSKKKK